MSDPKQKEKTKKFTLPNSLKNWKQALKNAVQSFAQDGKQAAHEHSKRQQKKRHSLFKLNPASAAHVSQSIDIIRKRSKSQKMEITDILPQKESFNLMDHQKEKADKHIIERKQIQKDYHIDILSMMTSEKKAPNNRMEQEEEPEKYEIVRPSEPYQLKQNPERQPHEAIFQPTIFQTPILPCFSSEFGKRAPETTKTVQEGEGLWKIGKIKVKGKRCQLRIGEFVFEGDQVRAEGKAGLVTEGCLHSLPSWKDMWILQPHESLFVD